MSAPTIIGGGIAGAAAACHLARAGHPPLVIERAAGPHHKICGEFLSVETVAELRGLGIEPLALGAKPIGEVRLAHGAAAGGDAAAVRGALALAPPAGRGADRARHGAWRARGAWARGGAGGRGGWAGRRVRGDRQARSARRRARARRRADRAEDVLPPHLPAARRAGGGGGTGAVPRRLCGAAISGRAMWPTSAC